MRLGGDYTALVITGPNTGGKTVALRTVGLLVLMHQAGLHVPVAEGSALPIFRDVLADIGDEQSVAQSLSTFSGHLRTITRIVDVAGEGTLVLLDELGAGTDPTEGSALAQSLLDHFIRAGALVVATTHYAELKTYAHNEPRARNASVDFDLATLAPTYHLSIGLPGTSQAFAIAERLGLPSALVEDARSRLTRGPAGVRDDAGLDPPDAADITAAEARVTDAEQRARVALAEAEEERRRARAERRVAAAEARRQAEVALAAIEAEIAEMRGALARETLTGPRLDQAMARIDARLAVMPRVEDRGDRGAAARGSAGRSANAPRPRAAGWARWRPSMRPGSVPRWTSAACASTWPSTSFGRPRRAGRPWPAQAGRRGCHGAAGAATSATAPRGAPAPRRRDPVRRRPGASSRRGRQPGPARGSRGGGPGPARAVPR